MLDLEVEIMLIRTWPHFDFFNLDIGLLLFGFLGFFTLLVFEFPIIHDLANRRIGVRRHFYQVKSSLTGNIQGFV